MTASDLTWAKAKDGIIIAIAGAMLALMVFVLKGQVELQRDFAVFSAEAKRDRADYTRLEARVTAIETQFPQRVRR